MNLRSCNKKVKRFGHYTGALSAFLFSNFVLILTNANSEYISPDTITVNTSRPELDQDALKTLKQGEEYITQNIALNNIDQNNQPTAIGDYIYSVDWQGIPMAKAVISVRPGEVVTTRVVTANARSNSAVDIFYKLRHESTSSFDINTFSPISFVSSQMQNKKSRTVDIKFNNKTDVVSKYTQDTKVIDLHFDPKNEMLDPITAAFMAKSAKIEVGKKIEFDVFNGKHRYLIKFTPHEEESIKVNGVAYRANKIIPEVVKLSDSEGEKRIRSVELWIESAPSRRILKMKSEVFIGKVTVLYEGFSEFRSEGRKDLMADSGDSNKVESSMSDNINRLKSIIENKTLKKIVQNTVQNTEANTLQNTLQNTVKNAVENATENQGQKSAKNQEQDNRSSTGPSKVSTTGSAKVLRGQLGEKD